MEEAQLRFGDITSADVKLWLTGPNDEDYEANPVHLHSSILNRSEFFKVKMSERWSSDKPTEIRITTSHNFDNYLTCIELMYSDPVNFSTIEECLAILSVASELLATDLINNCMHYLQGVHWSAAEETRVEDVLSSLGLKLSPDLAARFDKEDAEHTIFEERIIKQMVSQLQGWKDKRGNQLQEYSTDMENKDAKNKEMANKYIEGILKGNAPPDVVELCEREILQRFESSIRSCDISAIKFLTKLIDSCDGEILKAAYIAFVEDAEFTKYVKGKLERNFFSNRPRLCGDLLYTILSFLEDIGIGNIIVSRASRNYFLATWLPIMTELYHRRADMEDPLRLPSIFKLDQVNELVLDVVEGLPIADRKRICAEWIQLYIKYNIDITTPLTLAKKLQDAHYKLPSKKKCSESH